jgi:hypothetical protein
MNEKCINKFSNNEEEFHYLDNNKSDNCFVKLFSSQPELMMMMKMSAKSYKRYEEKKDNLTFSHACLLGKKKIFFICLIFFIGFVFIFHAKQ